MLLYWIFVRILFSSNNSFPFVLVRDSFQWRCEGFRGVGSVTGLSEHRGYQRPSCGFKPQVFGDAPVTYRLVALYVSALGRAALTVGVPVHAQPQWMDLDWYCSAFLFFPVGHFEKGQHLFPWASQNRGFAGMTCPSDERLGTAAYASSRPRAESDRRWWFLSVSWAYVFKTEHYWITC